jgi:hypothetical protein
VGKPERKRQIERPRHGLADNVKMDFIKKGWGGIYWLDKAHEIVHWKTLVNMVMNLQVPQNAGKFLSSCTTGDL